MAFNLNYRTESANVGKTLLIRDDSTDWGSQALTVYKMVITISSSLGRSGISETVIEFIDGVDGFNFDAGWQVEISDQQVGMTDGWINDIYNIKIELYSDDTTKITTEGYSIEAKELIHFLADQKCDNELLKLTNICTCNRSYSNYYSALFCNTELQSLFASSRKGDDGAIGRSLDIIERV